MKLIYVTVFEGNTSNSTGIYETQVLQFLSELQKQCDVTLIPIVASTLSDKFSLLLNSYDVKYHILKLKRKRHLFSNNSIIYFRNFINSLVDYDSIIMCREVLSAAFVLRAKTGAKLVLDKRGIPYLESLTFKNKCFINRFARYIIFKIIEKYVLCNFVYYRFVSNNMAAYYLKQTKIKAYIVQPTGVSYSNISINKYNLNKKWRNIDSFKIIYSGGKGSYHKFSEILKFMCEVNFHYSKFEFYIFSYFTNDELIKYKNEYPFIHFYNNLSHDCLVQFLSNSHFGICFRDESLINSVSAPTKVSEYLAFNLKVVYSGSIGLIDDFKKFLSDEFIINKFNFSDDYIRSFNVSNKVKKYLNFHDQAKSLINFLYQRVLN